MKVGELEVWFFDKNLTERVSKQTHEAVVEMKRTELMGNCLFAEKSLRKVNYGFFCSDKCFQAAKVTFIYRRSYDWLTRSLCKNYVWERGQRSRETDHPMTSQRPARDRGRGQPLRISRRHVQMCLPSVTPLGRYINHSSQPNLIHVAYHTEAGFDFTAFHATKRNNHGQELFFAYGSEFWNVSSYV